MYGSGQPYKYTVKCGVYNGFGQPCIYRHLHYNTSMLFGLGSQKCCAIGHGWESASRGKLWSIAAGRSGLGCAQLR